MGQEIRNRHFSPQDFAQFEHALRNETEELTRWFEEGLLADTQAHVGFELEAWLIDSAGAPAPVNDLFLPRVDAELVVPELANFNVELNGTPQPLGRGALANMHSELDTTWHSCCAAASALGSRILMIGMLPTATPADFCVENMSQMERYKAINEQAMRMRKGAPFQLDIAGRNDHFLAERNDVMLEAVTTSFQLHLQVSPRTAHRYYNAARIVSAPLVAIGANSPYLFGHDLWDETRIPIFEQAVDLAAPGAAKRVSFGHAFVRESLLESFQRNVQQYPPMLPTSLHDEAYTLAHLRMHNGTIWRWNRPLLGFDSAGVPHLRIEHRVLPAGPSTIDMFANAALFLGLVETLAQQSTPPEQEISFGTASANFYHAARDGLRASVQWLDGKTWPVTSLVGERLLELAARGLAQLGIPGDESEYYLRVIRERTARGINGAAWQRGFVARYGQDWSALVDAYHANQESGTPVHQWPLPAPTVAVSQPAMLELTELHSLPEGFLDTRAMDLHRLLPGPTLIHLPGRREQPVFISILLHGNEDTGLQAVQKLLRRYAGGRELPRAIALFVGNVEAARYGLRRLDGQPDYNRVWPGTAYPDSPERRLMAEVFARVQARNPFVSIDIHNNTGLNPHYACVNRLDNAFLHLATLFGRTVVYFIRPRGVQSAAFAQICPAVTLECGKVGQFAGTDHAADFVDACLRLNELPSDPVPAHDIELFHTVAIVRVPDHCSVGLGGENVDFCIPGDLDHLNFRELPKGTTLARLGGDQTARLEVSDEHGAAVGSRFIEYVAGEVRTRVPVMPSMLTLDTEVIRKDCLCYLMERLDPTEKKPTTA